MDIGEIQKRLQKIDELQGELKVAKDMLKDALDNDAGFQEAVEEAKVGNDKKKKIQNDIYNLSENKKVILDMKATKEEISTLKEILSEELIEYRNQHKTESIRLADGQMRVFKFSVKLSPKPSDS